MEELDKLKRDWQQRDHKFPSLTEQDLYKMLHRKSSSIVKWILIISLLEFLLLVGISSCYSFDSFKQISKHREIEAAIEIVNYLNFGVIAIFIYFFYKNYKSISTTASTKKLMSQILHTRKTVRNYVYYNLILAGLSFIFALIVALNESSEVKGLQQDLNEHVYLKVMMVVLILILFLVFLGVFWLYYKLLYGILLKRLYKNYEELKKIDQ